MAGRGCIATSPTSIFQRECDGGEANRVGGDRKRLAENPVSAEKKVGVGGTNKHACNCDAKMLEFMQENKSTH